MDRDRLLWYVALVAVSGVLALIAMLELAA